MAEPSTARMIVARAKLQPEDIVLEIGAGLGALTIPMARGVAKVYAVEKDPQICDLLRAELVVNKASNVTVIPGDILHVECRVLAQECQQQLVVMGNLPYHISSQILMHLIDSRKYIRRAVLMFQKELARRLTARPGCKDYGRLTVMLCYCADIKPVATIAASVFFPAPKVNSELLEISFKDPIDSSPQDDAMLGRVIKAAFGNRRKTLKNALAASGLKIDSQTARQALVLADINPSRRAETLSVSEFIALKRCLTQILENPEQS